MEETALSHADLDALLDTARSWRRYADRLHDYRDRLDHQVLGHIADTWRGDASDAATASAGRLRALCETRALRAEAMADVMEQWYDKSRPLQSDLRSVITTADPEDPDYATSVKAILGWTEAVAASVLGSINDLAPERPGEVGAHEYNDVHDDALEAGVAADVSCERAPGTPAENAKWWASLTDAEKSAYLLAYPQSVGAMDGLPVAARDKANRWNLHRDIEVGNDTEGARALLDTIESRDHLPAHQRVHLIGYIPPGPDGVPDVKAIVATGDPDTATHTGIFIPGTGTDLSTLSDACGLDRTIRLRDTADTLTPEVDGDVATIYWLGYDAPDGLASAALIDAADEGVPALTSFVDGLRESHGEPPAHLTVIGHSYGSVLLGHALTQGLDTDEAVALGSPGMGVDTADELRFPKDRLWAGAADDDYVPNLPPHGDAPTDPDFGARRLEVDTEGHDGYWEEGSESLANQGRVLTGQGS